MSREMFDTSHAASPQFGWLSISPLGNGKWIYFPLYKFKFSQYRWWLFDSKVYIHSTLTLSQFLRQDAFYSDLILNSPPIFTLRHLNVEWELKARPKFFVFMVNMYFYFILMSNSISWNTQLKFLLQNMKTVSQKFHNLTILPQCSRNAIPQYSFVKA